jgi:hypothetical protein
MPNFVQLRNDDKTTAADVVKELRASVEIGALIPGYIVVELIKRTNPSTEERAELHMLAERGIRKVRTACYSEEAKQHESAKYKEIVEYLKALPSV